MASITPGQIRQSNRLLIYHHIYNQKKVSQQDLCYQLHLSRPTVTNNLNALEKKGLIRHSGPLDSGQVGRKAAGYSIVPDYRVAIGVEITREELRILAVDLYGRESAPFSIRLEYFNADFYYKEVCRQITEYIRRAELTDAQVMGIGITLPALISPDGGHVTYGRLLRNTSMPITVFSERLKYPCTLIRDVNAAAVLELWASPDLDSAFYLSLSRHLGAAVIANRVIQTGKHGHNSTIEHLPMEPEGKPCYCGRRGCAETVCSISALLEEGEDLSVFFEKARREISKERSRYEAYLRQLSRLIHDLHLVSDTDFILGGSLAPYMTQEDVDLLHSLIREMTPFSEYDNFISISRAPGRELAVGAALPYIWSFLGSEDL